MNSIAKVLLIIQYHFMEKNLLLYVVVNIDFRMHKMLGQNFDPDWNECLEIIG